MAESTKKRKDHPRPASAEFWACWSGSCGEYVACDNCGRTVYATAALSEEEREKYRACDSKDVALDEHNDGIFSAYVLGVHCVYGCPCNAAGLLEERLLEHEKDLVIWLNMRRKLLRAKLERIDEACGGGDG